MERVYNQYLELYKELKELNKFCCIYSGSGLERIVKPDELKTLTKLGVYKPSEDYPKHAYKDLITTQQKMCDVSCKMIGLYELLDKEDSELAQTIYGVHKPIVDLNITLKELLFNTKMTTKLSDVQTGIGRVFNR